MGSGSSRRRGAAGGAAVPAGRAAAENRELLETVPAECEEAAAALPAPGRPAPAAGGNPTPRGAGRCGEAAAASGGGSSPLQQPALATRSPPGPEIDADHQCPQRNSKKLAAQSTVSYDYSEEELMASIEREYCR